MTTAQAVNDTKVLTYRSAQTEREWTARVGMIMFLASWAMMFAALFFVYGGVRARAPIWPPVELPALPLGHATLNTILALLSSVVLERGIRVYRGGKATALIPSLRQASLLGVAFLLSQAGMWAALYHAGLAPSSGTYGSSVYALTWVHAAHVLVGLFALFYLTYRAYRGAYNPARTIGVRLWAMYWHFVTCVWGVLFVTLFVV